MANTAREFVKRMRAAGRRPNRLINESSPYLLQHAFNPVDWRPWGEAAFAAARRADRPVFLSIGYATCHWCHVMEHESFEDKEIAARINQYYIPVKVDREERPDVDAVYMAATQRLTGGGGWPMTLFLTPDRRPFYAGTYFPPHTTNGRLGLFELLEAVHRAWQTKRHALLERADEVVKALAVVPEKGADTADLTALPGRAAAQFAALYDQRHGGFGPAPKFPRPAALSFLLAHAVLTGDRATAARVAATARAMAAGGIFDQLGGGFHRYSVDERWRLPHFEKMLYDQAQLARFYLDLHAATGKAAHRHIAFATLDFAIDHFQSPEGGFFSALDADSPRPGHEDQTAEGAYYLWQRTEIEALLPPDSARLFCEVYGVERAGNLPSGPHGDFGDANILYRSRETTAAEEKILAPARKRLLEERDRRPPPYLDDKIITADNGLMISALAAAAPWEPSGRYLQAALKAAGFLMANMVDAHGRMRRRFRAGRAGIQGVLQDEAFLSAGLLDLYEATLDTAWLRRALERIEAMMRFHDPSAGGFYDAKADDGSLPVRLKDEYDGAVPSGNAVAAMNCLRAARLTGEKRYLTPVRDTLAAFGAWITQAPTAMPALLEVVQAQGVEPLHAVIVGPPELPATAALRDRLRKTCLPYRVIQGLEPERNETLREGRPELAAMTMVQGRPTVYLCQGTQCRAPINDPDRLAAVLAKAATTPFAD